MQRIAIVAKSDGGMIMEIWIAKDKNGKTWLYKTEPTLNKELNMYDGLLFTNFSVGYFFPEVTFENSPQKVRIEIVKDE